VETLGITWYNRDKLCVVLCVVVEGEEVKEEGKRK